MIINAAVLITGTINYAAAASSSFRLISFLHETFPALNINAFHILRNTFKFTMQSSIYCNLGLQLISYGVLCVIYFISKNNIKNCRVLQCKLLHGNLNQWTLTGKL